jgi:hypothetical protein
MFDAGDWPEKPKPAFATNLHADITNCQTCGGDRFVVVSIRKPVQSTWMQERGLNASTESMYEEYAPCPDCGPDIPGTPDPGRVRQMMNG